MACDRLKLTSFEVIYFRHFSIEFSFDLSFKFCFSLDLHSGLALHMSGRGRPRGRPRGRGSRRLTTEGLNRRRSVRETQSPRGSRRRAEPPCEVPSEGEVDDESLSGSERAASESEPDEEAELAFFEDAHPWNSEEGFPKLMERMKLFYDGVNDPGHVCSICGERKFTGRPVSINKISSWHYDRKTQLELRKMLYSQFPDEKALPVVRNYFYFFNELIIINQYHKLV